MTYISRPETARIEIISEPLVLFKLRLKIILTHIQHVTLFSAVCNIWRHNLLVRRPTARLFVNSP